MLVYHTSTYRLTSSPALAGIKVRVKDHANNPVELCHSSYAVIPSCHSQSKTCFSLCRTLTEAQTPQCEEPNSMNEVHSLLQDQAETSVHKPDNTATQTSEPPARNDVKSSGIESTLLSQVDYTTRFPHLFQENPGADAFGLREMHHAATVDTKSSDVDANLCTVQPSADNLPVPFPPGFHNVAPCYRSPFQQATPTPLHNSYYDTTATLPDTTSYVYQNPNTLFPLSSAHQSYVPPAVPLSGIIPSANENKLQTLLASQRNRTSTVPYAQPISNWSTDTNNTVPSTPPYAVDGMTESQEHHKDSVFDINHQIFSGTIPPPLSAVFDHNIPDIGSHASTSETVGDSKPIGFVPAVKGSTFKSEAETATEVEDVIVHPQGQDATTATVSRLTTTARVQPSSSVLPQQQLAVGNTIPEPNDSDVHNLVTGDEHKTANDSPRPPLVPGYPAPWAMPPYPGAPFPYPFYPPWPYCPPMPMMPMMPHPMMSMVPVPCWMPPMHPAMRMPPPITPVSAADTNDKAEVITEAKS